jgi:hypothetical protein
MTPFFWRKSEIANGIEIRGSDGFILHTREALALLKPTAYFQGIQRHIAIIQEAKRSGMKA